MSSCEVTVHLQGTAESLPAGADVCGTVSLWSDAPFEATKVHIQQLWRVHGRGNTDETVLSERTEEVPALVPGMIHEVRFSFRAPARPVSYHGRYINVDHYVRARVDKPWGRDPKAEADYVVTPGRESADAYLSSTTQEQVPQKTPGCMKVVGWILLPVIVVLLLALLLLLLPILLVVGAVILIRKMLAERRLGHVHLEIDARKIESGKPYTGPGAAIVKKLAWAKGGKYVVSPGQAIPVTLRFTPPGDVTLNGATLDLRAAEVATSGSGTNATTYRENVWEEKVPLIEPRSLMRGHPVEVTAQVTLPQTIAFSLDTSSNKITWTATVRVDIPNWPDWVKENELLMIPAP